MIAGIVQEYLRENPGEQDGLGQLLDLINKHSDETDVMSRENMIGHITASGFVIHRGTGMVLRILHKKLNDYLQPGGHLDPSDSTPLQAAIREIGEEVSIWDLQHLNQHFNEEIPIDIDSHPILANTEREEKMHFHHDFRYLFLTDTFEDLSIRDSEVEKYRWDDLHILAQQSSFSRIVKKIEHALGPEMSQRYFYIDLLKEIGSIKRTKSFVVTHILPDIRDYLLSIEQLTNIAGIIPKPKSIDASVYGEMRSRFNIINVKRDGVVQALDDYLSADKSNDQVVLFDIGGWFAPAVTHLFNKYPKRIVGVVEDTENGHQKYLEVERHDGLPVPVVSVARSPLKDSEDYLVGQSVLFSSDSILRLRGLLLDYLSCGVLGYGKIGSSIAQHLLLRGVKPNVFDPNPIRRIAAYNQNCNVPKKESVICKSDVLFCATGSQALKLITFRKLKNGCYIFSVTSSDDEFDLTFLKSEYKRTTVLLNEETRKPIVERFSSRFNYFYMVNEGNAVNFIHKAVVGPFIHLVRGEMLLAYKYLVGGHFSPGVHDLASLCKESPDKFREIVANSWSKFHIDSTITRISCR